MKKWNSKIRHKLQISFTILVLYIYIIYHQDVCYKMTCRNANGANILFPLLYGLSICLEVEFIETICGSYHISLISNRLLKKNRFIRTRYWDRYFSFLSRRNTKRKDWKLHHAGIPWIFPEVAAAWQECDMFSFGEIPTFKRYRGGADRYRLYDHEFPSREYNLFGDHMTMFLWRLLILVSKDFYFLNWMNYWRALLILLFFFINSNQVILNWIRSFLRWFEYDYLRISTCIWLWLDIIINWLALSIKDQWIN